MTQLDPIQRDILVEGLEDYVGLWEVARLVREAVRRPGEDAVRQAAIERLRPLLEGGYMEAGDLTPDGGFAAWSSQGKGAVDQIDKRWRRLGRDPSISEICWLNNTGRGNALARGQ